MDCDKIKWRDLSDAEKLELVDDILIHLRLEPWFTKFDGEPRRIELREIEERT